MADEKDVEKQEEPKQEKTDEKARSPALLVWIIMAVVVVLCAAAGFGLGRSFGGFRVTEATESSQQDEAAPIEDLRADDSANGAQGVWYYDLEPVVACLDEPGVRRYVRATLTLAMTSQVDRKKGTVFLEEKKPVLVSWLTIFLASLNLEDVRGDRNLKRIQSQILDAFNEMLFPEAKPQMNKVLFKEFAVQ